MEMPQDGAAFERNCRIPLFVPRPMPLLILARLWIATGIYGILDILLSVVLTSYDTFNLCGFGVFIGTGLLRFHRVWRGVAIFWAFIQLYFSFNVFAALILYPSRAGNFASVAEPFGQGLLFLATYGKVIPVLLYAILLLSAIWQIWTLYLPEVRTLFSPENPYFAYKREAENFPPAEATNILDDIRQMEAESASADEDK